MAVKAQALNSIEIVRKRPGMFIGDIQTPDHLAEEILDNALDEVGNGYASSISIFSNVEDGSFWISDNGRGIEVTSMTLPDSDQTDDSINILCTRLFSGTKFDTDDYSKLIGMHGVGLVAVNALSEWLIVKTRDRKDKNKVYTYTFKNAELDSKIEEIDNDFSYSTIIGFKPDKQYFETLEFNHRHFIERLICVQAVYGLTGFNFNNNPIPEISFDEFVRQHLGLNKEDDLSILSYKKNNFMIKVLLTYLSEDDNIVIGNVNTRTCDGKFLNNLISEIKKSISDKIDKRYNKVVDKDGLSGLRMYVLVEVPEPKFDSQTKVRMTLDIKKTLINPIKNQIDIFIQKNIKTIENNLERKLHKSIVNNSGKNTRSNKRVSAENKLKDCKHIPGDVLYIVEGDSAEGTLNQFRNKLSEACFPLRGKVLNVESSTFEKIQNNKEFKDLMEALGPPSNRRYKKVKIVADGDLDGAHIDVLSILIFQKFAPDFIKSGNLSVVIPPLFGGEKGKQYIPIYNQEKLEEFKKKGFIITRFKGLGEMNADQLEQCIRSGHEYQIKWPDNQEQLNNLISIITDTEVKRAIMNQESVKMELILKEVEKQIAERSVK